MRLGVASFRGAEPPMRKLFEFPFSEKRRSGTCHNSSPCIAKKRQCFSHSLTQQRERSVVEKSCVRGRCSERQRARRARPTGCIPPQPLFYLARPRELFRADICVRMGMGNFSHFRESVKIKEIKFSFRVSLTRK